MNPKNGVLKINGSCAINFKWFVVNYYSLKFPTDSFNTTCTCYGSNMEMVSASRTEILITIGRPLNEVMPLKS